MLDAGDIRRSVIGSVMSWKTLTSVLAQAVVILVTIPSVAFTWGSDGHRIVGALADKLVASFLTWRI